LIAQKSFHPEQGARAVRKTTQEMVENSIAKALLSGTIKKGGSVNVTGKGEHIKLTVK